MRALTYNLWHGLAPTSPVVFEALEPEGRRQLREALQLELLRELKPDLAFFQEVNPVSRRAPLLAQAAGAEFCYQPDLVGLKLLGLGLPLNLNSGLMIAVNQKYGLKKVEGVSLSRPGTHYVHSWGSWQLKEERFALFCETLLPDWGRVLLINTHLHHGLEATAEFEQGLQKIVKQLDLSESIEAEIHSRMRKGSERRDFELGVLLKTLEKYERRFETVILAGDFNASPESTLWKPLRERGFRDVWLESHPEDPGLSFDETRNQANHFLQARFPLTLVVEDLSFSNKTKEALLRLARTQETRPRRIDYLWVRKQSPGVKVRETSLVGLPNSEGLAASDHFGVCADLEVG
jgi:endonuclease/exonuclease/phosphatase family metal-dependent hydrolase